MVKVAQRKMRRISVSQDVHRLLMIRRAETGKPMCQVADEAIRAALAQARRS